MLWRPYVRYNLRSIYSNQFSGLSRNLFFIDNLLKQGSKQLRNRNKTSKPISTWTSNHFLLNRKHLRDNNIEAGLYAHQWVLSWFCCRFPLNFSARILDLISLHKDKANIGNVLILITLSFNAEKGNWLLNFKKLLFDYQYVYCCIIEMTS